MGAATGVPLSSVRELRLRPGVIVGDVSPVGGIIPCARFTGGIGRSRFEPASVEINYVAVLLRAVREHIPGQRMILLTDSEQAAEAHDGVFGFTRALRQHHIVN